MCGMNEQLPKTSGADDGIHPPPPPPPPPLYVRGLRFSFFSRPLRGVHLFHSNQRFDAIEFVDRHVSEKL